MRLKEMKLYNYCLPLAHWDWDSKEKKSIFINNKDIYEINM